MSSRVLSAERIEEIDVATMPEGEYTGVWGGYIVNSEIGGKQYRFRVEDGIRTPAAPCIVSIHSGVAEVRVV